MFPLKGKDSHKKVKIIEPQVKKDQQVRDEVQHWARTPRSDVKRTHDKIKESLKPSGLTDEDFSSMETDDEYKPVRKKSHIELSSEDSESTSLNSEEKTKTIKSIKEHASQIANLSRQILHKVSSKEIHDVFFEEPLGKLFDKSIRPHSGIETLKVVLHEASLSHLHKLRQTLKCEQVS